MCKYLGCDLCIHTDLQRIGNGHPPHQTEGSDHASLQPHAICSWRSLGDETLTRESEGRRHLKMRVTNILPQSVAINDSKKKARCSESQRGQHSHDCPALTADSEWKSGKRACHCRNPSCFERLLPLLLLMDTPPGSRPSEGCRPQIT